MSSSAIQTVPLMLRVVHDCGSPFDMAANQPNAHREVFNQLQGVSKRVTRYQTIRKQGMELPKHRHLWDHGHPKVFQNQPNKLFVCMLSALRKTPFRIAIALMCLSIFWPRMIGDENSQTDAMWFSERSTSSTRDDDWRRLSCRHGLVAECRLIGEEFRGVLTLVWQS